MPPKPLCHLHHCAERSCPQTHVRPGVQAFQSWTRVGPLPCLPFSIKQSLHRADAIGSPLRFTAAPPHTHCTYLCQGLVPLHTLFPSWLPSSSALPNSEYLSEPVPPASPKKPSEAASPRAFLLSTATSELGSPAAFPGAHPRQSRVPPGHLAESAPPSVLSFQPLASSPHSLALPPPRCRCTSLYPPPGSSLSFPI